MIIEYIQVTVINPVAPNSGFLPWSADLTLTLTSLILILAFPNPYIKP